jgi:hypothetical protein
MNFFWLASGAGMWKCNAQHQRRCEALSAACMLLLDDVSLLATTASHLVTKRHHAALVGFDLRQMEGDVSVELLEELDPIANQDWQDRITNFVG